MYANSPTSPRTRPSWAHYSGNFWWASCSYIRTLQPPRPPVAALERNANGALPGGLSSERRTNADADQPAGSPIIDHQPPPTNHATGCARPPASRPFAAAAVGVRLRHYVTSPTILRSVTAPFVTGTPYGKVPSGRYLAEYWLLQAPQISEEGRDSDSQERQTHFKNCYGQPSQFSRARESSVSKL